MEKQSCYLCCSLFSFVGFLFLMLIGAIFQLQPQFVHGAKHGKDSAPAIFQAAAMYAGCVVILFILWRREKSRNADVLMIAEQVIDKDSSYRPLPDAEESLPLTKHMSPSERDF